MTPNITSEPRLKGKGDVALDLASVVIQSERLMLKPVSLKYAPEMFREFTPEITRFTFASSPERIEETEQFIASTIEKRSRCGELVMVILLRATGEFLGVCGLHAASNAREPELGIWLAKGAHGNRYGAEAICALCGWAAERLEVDALVYPVYEPNISSRRIPESMGAPLVAQQASKRSNGESVNKLIYRIPAKISSAGGVAL